MATRQTRRQLQFTGFEMAMIGVSFVVTVTAVFFLGLFVGKKNASYHAPAEDRVARVPVDDFTKYKRPAPIEKPKPAPAAPAAEAAAPAADTAKVAAEAPATADHARAEAPASAAPAGSTPAGAAKTGDASKDAAAKDAAKGKEEAPREAAAREAAAKEAAAREAAAKAKEAKEAAEASTGRGYTVQILATRKQAEADALVQKLKSRGYAAYIKKVSEGDGAWFRVRVGSYSTFGDARGMADKCRRELSLGQAFVSTE